MPTLVTQKQEKEGGVWLRFYESRTCEGYLEVISCPGRIDMRNGSYVGFKGLSLSLSLSCKFCMTKHHSISSKN